ncbi:unnamed protein product [Caenorhabditis brenneri]
MSSNLKTARQSLDVARPTRASQARSRQSSMGGRQQNEQSVQGRLVHPRWNINTKISSPTKTTDSKAETADQKIKRFRKREEALAHKSPGVGAWNRSGVSNHGINPPRRYFSDLPVEILSQILENLDPISRLVTRNVSRTLRSIVDSQKPKIYIIHLFEWSKRITCGLQQLQQEISFIQMKDVCTVRRRRKTTNVRGGDYVNLTLQLLKPILLNPKLTLSRLILRFKEGSEFIQRLFDLMSEVVKANNSQFHVGSLDIDRCTEKKSDSWLPLFKAGVLHNLEVAVDTRRGVVNCSESEQFKGAKSIKINPPTHLGSP